MKLRVFTEDFTKQTSSSTAQHMHCNTQQFRLEHYGIKIQDSSLLITSNDY